MENGPKLKIPPLRRHISRSNPFTLINPGWANNRGKEIEF
jgi:hypothetical protein